MSTAPICSSQPSIWRLGMVDWRFNFGVYAAIVVGQFLINSTVGAIMYATSDDLSGHVDQSALNAAFMTGIYIFVAAIITTTPQLRAASLSGASRSTLALSTYVLSAVVIAIASVIWWVLALTQTHIFFLGSLGYPLGVDSWLIVVRNRAMDESRGRSPSALLWRSSWEWPASHLRSPGWSSPSSTSPVTCPRCTRASGSSASSLSQSQPPGGA